MTEKDLKTLKLSDKETKSVQSVLRLFNTRPETVKNDIQSILKHLKKDKVENKKTSSLENIASAIEPIQVNAWCGENSFSWDNWWGTTTIMNSCRADRYAFEFREALGRASIFVSTGCVLVGLVNVFATITCGFISAIAINELNYLPERLNYFVQNCGWVVLDFDWWGWYNVYPAC